MLEAAGAGREAGRSLDGQVSAFLLSSGCRFSSVLHGILGRGLQKAEPTDGQGRDVPLLPVSLRKQCS